MIATAVAGPLIAWLGDAAFPPLFIALALLRGLLSLQLPQFRAPDHVRKAVTPGKLKAVLKPWFMLTLLGIGVLYSTHSAFGAFSALLWRDQGIPGEVIGPLVATMAAAEALMMFLWKRLKLKIPARNLIILACLIAAFRWTAMAFSPPVWVLFLLQTLHAFTYAMGYLGGMYFIANWTSEDIAAEAQGFSYFVAAGHFGAGTGGDGLGRHRTRRLGLAGARRLHVARRGACAALNQAASTAPPIRCR